MKIYLQGATGQEPSSLQVNSTDTLGELKNAIVHAEGLQGCVLSLVLEQGLPGERELDDSMNEMSLADVPRTLVWDSNSL